MRVIFSSSLGGRSLGSPTYQITISTVIFLGLPMLNLRPTLFHFSFDSIIINYVFMLQEQKQQAALQYTAKIEASQSISDPSTKQETEATFEHNLSTFAQGRDQEIESRNGSASLLKKKVEIEKILTSRWLKTAEVYFLLNNMESLFNLGYRVQDEALVLSGELPQSGSLYIYKKEAKVEWRRDGHCWQKRKGCVSVRQDFQKLKYRGIQEVVCTYVFGAGEEATPKNMRRKGYWLINNPDYILVHYLEVVPKKKAQENTSDTLARASEILKQAMRNNLEETKERAHQNYTLSPSTWNMPIEPLSPIQEDVQQTRCYEFGVHHEIQLSEIPHSEEQQTYSEQHHSEADLHDLFGLNLRIIDFSPEWDYSEGGAKVIVCLKPSLPERYMTQTMQDKFSCKFGDSYVPVQFIQNGVFKCRAPQHSPGFVKIRLTFCHQRVTDRLTPPVDDFLYKQKENNRKLALLRARDSGTSEYEQDCKEFVQNIARDFKVRIIERLGYLEHQARECQNCSSSSQYCEGQLEEMLANLDLQEKKEFMRMSPEELETLTQEKLEETARTVFERLLSTYPDDFYDRINRKDENGCALIHYTCALDFDLLINLYDEFGVDLNVKTRHNLTPIIICAAKGNQKCLARLIEYGAKVEFSERASTSSGSNSVSSSEFFDSKPLFQIAEEKSIMDVLLKAPSLDLSIEEAGNPHSVSSINSGKKRGCRSAKQTPKSGTGDKIKDVLFQQQQAMLIQRNVRAWLLRRQQSDIQKATNFLKSQLKGKMKGTKKKQVGQKEAAILIQRTVRNWLSSGTKEN